MIEYRLFALRIGLVGVTNLISSLSSILLVPILTKNISASDYGIWAQIGITIGLLSTIISFGLSSSMIRFLASNTKKDVISENFYSIFVVIFLSAATVSLTFFLFSKHISELLFNDNLAVAEIFPLLIVIGPLNGLLFNFFRTFQQIKIHSIFIVISTFLNIFLVAYFVLTGYGIYGAVIGLVLTQYVLFSLMFTLIVLKIGIKMPRFIDIREFLHFGLPTVPESLASWAVNSSDRYFISFFLGTAFVGFYSPGYILGNMINMFTLPISFLLPALLSRYYDSNNIQQVEFLLSYSLKYFLALSIPSVMGLSLLSKSILTVLSTPQIAAEGYIITPFTALSSLFLGILAILSNTIALKKKTAVSSSIWVTAAMLNMLLNAVMIPVWGIIGAGAATLVSFTYIFILTAYTSFKYLKVSLDRVFVLKSIFASGIMSMIIAFQNPIGFIQILFLVIISATIYFIVLVILQGFKKEEILFFINIIKNIY